jgi:hypothetical protein
MMAKTNTYGLFQERREGHALRCESKHREEVHYGGITL